MKRATSNRSLRVLLIEDNPPDAILVRESLRADSSARIEIASTDTLAGGLRSLEEQEFDALLLDLSLPDTVGLETLGAILSRHPRLPVVVLTGNDDERVAGAAMRRGAQDYLVKGRFDGYQLASAILHAIERKSQEDRIRANALRDVLTGLPNRALLGEHARACFARFARDESKSFALVLLDVDRFKSINDVYGHPAGDAALVEVARRLKSCVRRVDTVARMGGDEFVLLLEDIDGFRGTLRVMGKVHAAMRAPIDLGGSEVETSVSAGVALVSRACRPAGVEDLLQQADLALYRAKERGRGLTELFDATMQRETVERQELENKLQRAVERRQLRVRYQPLVRLADGEITGFEALVRWMRAEDGAEIPAAELLGVAEETGLIHQIRQQVLREACGLLRSLPGFESLSINVNLSNSCFNAQDLGAEVRSVLAETDLPPRCLRLEITEGVILKNGSAERDRMGELDELGVRWHLDDFGTWNAPLEILESLPISGIGIDRRFVRRAWKDGAGPGLVRSMIVLARDLGLEAVAEGIETVSQRDHLRELCCDEGQGFLFGRPMGAEAVPAALAAGRGASGPVSPAGAPAPRRRDLD